MVHFSIDEIRGLMSKPQNIRNISVIAHVDHGKSTLTDSLVSKAGIISRAKAGETRFTDTRKDEQDRCITIKSTSISMYYEHKEKSSDKGIPYLINLIDSPGHVDFSSEVTTALRVTDGALVVVDCIEGVCVQTETVLRQAITEKIVPILFLNKLDRIFLELNCTSEDAYNNFRRAIESVNLVIQTQEDEDLGDVHVDPVKGNVGFGSGLHAWGFTIQQFAEKYSSKFGIDQQILVKKFWGENFFNPKTNKWTKKQSRDGKTLHRGFCYFILDPILKLVNYIMDNKKEQYEKILKRQNIVLPKEAEGLTLKPLLKAVMRTWLPAGDVLLKMVVENLPSPIKAQKYRVKYLYTGDQNDKYAKAIRDCDVNGPLMMFVSKMVPTVDKNRFYAFGRVFSGKIATGKKVRIMGSKYVRGKKTDLYQKNIQRTIVMMGRYTEAVPDVPCGNVVGLAGVDKFILKCGTITEENAEDAYNIAMMKFSVSAVVNVAVEPKNSNDLPKLVEGLNRLSKSDPLVKCERNKTGQHIISGAGELHLEICLKDLKEDFLKNMPLHVSEPIVSYAETISEETDMVCIAKSPNKHNRLYFTAEPLGEELCKEIDEGEVKESDDIKVRAKHLVTKHNWDSNEARKIWSFGCPPHAIPNMIVDASKGVQYLSEIKDSVIGAFMQVTNGGIYCDEVMRGICFKVNDVTLHADAIHRGAGQIMPAAKKAFYACQIKSGPTLMEPIYLVNISVNLDSKDGVYNTLGQRRGRVVKEEDIVGSCMCNIVGYLPVKESFGFTSLLRKNTGGRAFPQMNFSHWDFVSGSPENVGSMCHEIVTDIRKRKGMKVSLPEFKDYYDKI